MSRVNNYDAHGEVKPVEDVQGLATALRQSLDVRELRTLSSVPEYFSNPSGNPRPTAVDPAELHPQLRVPAENLCPSNPNSPEHSPKLNIPDTPASPALGTDPRCDATNQNANFSSDYYGHIWVGDAADLGLALGQVPSARATAAPASGGVVSLPLGLCSQRCSRHRLVDLCAAGCGAPGHAPGDPQPSEQHDSERRNRTDRRHRPDRLGSIGRCRVHRHRVGRGRDRSRARRLTSG